jgi:glycine betaine catabolism B
MTLIDNLLNRITMYRLVLYYLIALVAAAIVFGAFGILPYSPLAIIVSTLIVIAACWLTNAALAKMFRVPANAESIYITGLILALIISPIALKPFDLNSFGFLIAASLFAMASKYILAVRRKHIFNPAAIAIVITAFVFGQYASWWVGGNLPLFAFVVIGGLLVVRKIQRFDLVLSFAIAAVVSTIVTNPGFDPFVTAEKALIHTSLLFFAFVMLTEPLTTPPTRKLRIAYGLLVGALFSPAIHIGSIYSAPELALVAGNIFSYAVSPKRKYKLTLKSKTAIGADTYDFVFAMGGNDDGRGSAINKTLNFQPGQYMEFTLPAPGGNVSGIGSGLTGTDGRGNRRYFTIASSPTEPELHLGVKFYGDAVKGEGKTSSFKKTLLALRPGDTMMGGQLAGDFTLPRGFANGTDANHKFVFIAGGIGITPFRSMVKYLVDINSSATAAPNQKRDIVLLYSNRTANEIPYREVFDEAAATQNIKLKNVYVVTAARGNEQPTRIDAVLIMREVPDYRERMFYISGTHAMVSDLKKILRELKIPPSRIKTDFFPGFA